MPIPTAITDLSTTAASNYPAGSDSPAVLDDTQRAHAAFIAQLRDGKGFSNPVVLASATTTDIGGQSSQFVEVSGTTTITSLGTTYNGPRYVRFQGALTLTHNATTLNIFGSASVATSAGYMVLAIPNQALNGWNVFPIGASGSDFLNTTRIDVASAGTVNLTSSAPNTRNINITGTTTITAFTVAIGQLYFVRFNAALTLTNNANIVTQTGANITTAAGDTCILRATAANTVEVLNYVSVSSVSAGTLRSSLAGLTLSTAGSSTTMTTAAGQAADSTNAVLMSLASAISKTLSAWVVGTGNGGLDTGTVANNTWYHSHLIRRPDTGVVDVLFSLSATAPTLPANYTQFRRIGSGKTNGSAQWTSFIQNGDEFKLLATVLDSTTTTSTAASTFTLASIPTGISVEAIFRGGLGNGATVNGYYLWSDLAVNDEAPSVVNSQIHAVNAGDQSNSVEVRVRTNTSAQIRGRSTANDGNINIRTVGWIDRRGRDA